jgi:hypothetical protein
MRPDIVPHTCQQHRRSVSLAPSARGVVMSGQPGITMRSSRLGNIVLAILMLGMVAALVAMIVFWDNDSLFYTRDTHNQGLIKPFQRLIGWPAFLALVVLLGLWFLAYALVQIWKVIDTTPDVTATPSGLRFHPSMHKPAAYGDVDHWSFEGRSKGAFLSIRFRDPYWSLQSLFRRRSMTINDTRANLQPLADYLLDQPEMKLKFRPGPPGQKRSG